MAKFIGTKKEFHMYFDGYCKNKINYITRTERNACDGICEYCGNKHELQSAHIRTEDRNYIVNNILDKYTINDIIDLDLNNFEKLFVEMHKPIENHFHFLCQECHNKYDRDLIPESKFDELKIMRIQSILDDLKSSLEDEKIKNKN